MTKDTTKQASNQALPAKNAGKTIVCKICGQQLKRLNNSHLQQHGITFAEYRRRYEPEAAKNEAIIDFLNKYYIQNRSKWVEARPGADEYKTISRRAWPLNDDDLRQHLSGSKTIGASFFKTSTNLIGIDIDIPDPELLNRITSCFFAYGIERNNFLISFSGKKGYHVDIFLAEPLSRAIVKEFFNILMRDIDGDSEEIELYGSSDKCYKLPLGYHPFTRNYCGACDEWGNNIEALSSINEIIPVDPVIICDALEVNYLPIPAILNEAEQLDSSINLLSIYSKTNQASMKQVERLLSDGIKEKGRRHISIRTVAAYCKDVKGLCLGETIDFIKRWVNSTWAADCIDAAILRNIEHTARSVFNTGFKFRVHANEIKITLPEIKEVFSVKAGNKLKTDALRRLYYCFLIHYKAYGGADGSFFMTFQQLSDMGSTLNRNRLGEQIDELCKLGKLQVISRNKNAGRASQSKFKRPNFYLLPNFAGFEHEISDRAFSICGKEEKCENCMYKALAHLSTEKERRQHIKGKDFKALPACEMNP